MPPPSPQARAQAQCVDRLSLRRERAPGVEAPHPPAPILRARGAIESRAPDQPALDLAGRTDHPCRRGRRPRHRVPDDARSFDRTPDSNVLLITIDTLRADALGSYGNTRARTPVLDRLAANGVRFTTTRAHSVVTLPSHISLLTGLYPFSHGVRDNAGFRLPAERRHARDGPQGARLSHRCLRERVPARFAIRPGARVRRIRRSVRRRGRRVRVPGARTARRRRRSSAPSPG